MNKERTYIDKDLKEKIEKQIENLKNEMGVEFDVDNIFIYGSSLSQKENPNDIDIFLKVSNINSDYADDFVYDSSNGNSEFDSFKEFLLDKSHDFLHGSYGNKQIVHRNKKVDINIQEKSFDDLNYDGEYIEIDKYIEKLNEKKYRNKENFVLLQKKQAISFIKSKNKKSKYSKKGENETIEISDSHNVFEYKIKDGVLHLFIDEKEVNINKDEEKKILEAFNIIKKMSKKKQLFKF